MPHTNGPDRIPSIALPSFIFFVFLLLVEFKDRVRKHRKNMISQETENNLGDNSSYGQYIRTSMVV